MYVLETRTALDGARPDGPSWRSTTLREMTRAQLARAIDNWEVYRSFNNHERDYRVVPWQAAHRYVRNGGHHETTLWVDDGRIRKA